MKSHAIDVLVRENPVGKPYYELIWSKLTFTDVCNYKMGKVYEQVPEEGFDEETRPDTELTVLQYFSVLFREL
jgi:hypothetical protein